MSDPQVLELGDVVLERGGTLKDARLAYQTHGKLNAAGDNCVVFPTYYTGTHDSNARMIGPGRALDPGKWFIVVPNLFGNGVSSSPSNAAPVQRGVDFPHCSALDNVRCQHRLVVDHLGVSHVALALGWSMGAMQAYQWAVAYPDLVHALLPICGAARCAPHNAVFLAGLRATLAADGSFNGGRYSEPPKAGLKAFGRVYAGWAYSQRFYKEGRYRDLGFASVEALLTWWENDHLGWDANDLLAKIATWETADVAASAPFNGDLAAALGAIRAKTIVMPGDRDLYFTLDDNAEEAALIPGAELRPLVSVYGHCAGAPGRFPAEMAFIESAIRDLLGD